MDLRLKHAPSQCVSGTGWPLNKVRFQSSEQLFYAHTVRQYLLQLNGLSGRGLAC